jgi:hypothetical protein
MRSAPSLRPLVEGSVGADCFDAISRGLPGGETCNRHEMEGQHPSGRTALQKARENREAPVAAFSFAGRGEASVATTGTIFGGWGVRESVSMRVAAAP